MSSINYDELKKHLTEINQEFGKLTDSQRLTGIAVLLEGISQRLSCISEQLDRLMVIAHPYVEKKEEPHAEF